MIIEERILNVVWAKRKHRWVPRFALGLKGWAGISQVELHAARCTQTEVQTHGKAPWAWDLQVSHVKGTSTVFKPRPISGESPVAWKRGSVHTAVFLLKLQTHPPLLDSPCFRTAAHLHLFIQGWTDALSSRTWALGHLQAQESAQRMCVNPLPNSWWLSGTFPFTSITHDPASYDSLSGVDGAQGYRWSPRFPCSTFTWICTQTFLWSLPSPDAVFSSEGADKTSRGSAVLEF